MGNGNRTRNRWSHSPVLCQLSYSHREKFIIARDSRLGVRPAIANPSWASTGTRAKALPQRTRRTAAKVATKTEKCAEFEHGSQDIILDLMSDPVPLIRDLS